MLLRTHGSLRVEGMRFVHRVVLILSYTLIWIFQIYELHFKDPLSLCILYKHFPEPVAGNFLHGMLSGGWQPAQVFPGRCLHPSENYLWETAVMWETEWAFLNFFFFLSSFFKPDNFLQLIRDLILISWSFMFWQFRNQNVNEIIS